MTSFVSYIPTAYFEADSRYHTLLLVNTFSMFFLKHQYTIIIPKTNNSLMSSDVYSVFRYPQLFYRMRFFFFLVILFKSISKVVTHVEFGQ